MPKLLVHFHVFYEEQIPWFLEKLGNINGCQWDLYVTYSRLSEKARELISAAFPDAVFMEVENVGYDVWPFIKLLKSIDIGSYDYVMKLHTKSASSIKTKWRGIYLDGTVWRDRLVDAMLLDRERFAEIIARLGEDSTAGLFCHRMFLVKPTSPFPEDNEALETELSRIGLDALDRHFCAGTMFIARISPFNLLRSADLTQEMFSSGMASHGNGSLAHVYERIISFAVSSAGYRLIPLDTPPFREKLMLWMKDHISPILEAIFSIRQDRTETKYLTLLGIKIPLGRKRLRISPGKNYLVVALDVANTAPGIVFKTLLRSLSETSGIILLAEGIDESILNPNIKYIPLRHSVQDWGRAVKKWKKLGFNPRDVFWSWKTWLRKRREIERYSFDCIVTLTSNGYYSSLNLGRILSRRFRKKKYVIYSVDGMPSPLPWLGGDNRLHRNISRQIARLCSGADIFVLSNPRMALYQKSVMPEYKGAWDYLFTPYRLLPPDFSRKEHDGYNLLYAGSLYGLRRIDSLVEAFRRYLALRPDATLYFVGERAPGYEDTCPDLTESGRIVFRDHTERIEEYYSIADCLIDIAADIPDDVFLSSKVICYLPYEIPILAISGANSPVSEIMKYVPSIANSSYDADEIYNALLSLEGVDDFTDRSKLLEVFHPDSMYRKFKSILEK